MGHQTAQLSCPVCRARVSWEIYSSVNVTQEPALKLRVLSNELGRFTCPRCGAMAYLSQPLLYHDMDQRLMIQLTPREDFDATALSSLLDKESLASIRAMTTRLVSTWNDLREKVLLFDAGLDDHAIEVVKLMARSHRPEVGHDELFFEELEGENLHFTVIGDDDPRSIVVPAEMYRSLRADIDGRGLIPGMPERWQRIDRRYATSVLQQMALSPVAQA